MIISRHYITTDASGAEGIGKSGGKPNGVECRVYSKGDPGCYKGIVELPLIRKGAGEDDGKSFTFFKKGDDLIGWDAIQIGSGTKYIFPLVQAGLHGFKQLNEVFFAGHRFGFSIPRYAVWNAEF